MVLDWLYWTRGALWKAVTETKKGRGINLPATLLETNPSTERPTRKATYDLMGIESGTPTTSIPLLLFEGDPIKLRTSGLMRRDQP